MGICSFDIETIYTNVTKPEFINIIWCVIENGPEIIKTNQEEIINILKALMDQNYFQFDQQNYKQSEPLARMLLYPPY